MTEAQAGTDVETEDCSGISLSGLMADATEQTATLANYQGEYDKYREHFGQMDDYGHHPHYRQ
jgi:hypothetical protein